MTDEVKQGIEQSLELFVSAIERTSNLEIVCADTVDDKDILVVENSEIDNGIEGHQCQVDVSEIFAKIVDCKDAQTVCRCNHRCKESYCMPWCYKDCRVLLSY